MVLGQTDSGKTSLVQLLAQYLVKRQRKVAVIDADIGQSTLGPPGTVGLSLMDIQTMQSEIIPVDYTVFVGAISPERCVNHFIQSVYRLYQISRHGSSEAAFIDTTGLVAGDLGVYLKSSLIKKIHPTVLIALQWDKELEPILEKFDGDKAIHVFCLKPYQDIRKKDWRERKERREKQFSDYFRGAALKEIDFSCITLKGVFIGLGAHWKIKDIIRFNRQYQTEVVGIEKLNSKIVLIAEKQQNLPGQEMIAEIKKDYSVQQVILITQPWFKNLLISFNNRENRSNGLGIIKEIHFGQKKIITYLPEKVFLEDIAEIEMGQLKIRLDGRELIYDEPEKY